VRKLVSLSLLIVLLCGAMPTIAQDNTGFETTVYSLNFYNLDKVNGHWFDSPINLSLDNVQDHMTRVFPDGDCVHYTIVAQLISSEFVVIDHIYCPLYYESWHIDMIEFRDLSGETFDF